MSKAGFESQLREGLILMVSGGVLFILARTAGSIVRGTDGPEVVVAVFVGLVIGGLVMLIGGGVLLLGVAFGIKDRPDSG